ncbi:alcohol dehydrogenase [Sclerotinia borealis F-4128]|uniref:Alcohol dehydrogenase n=1 Tax=Sclerotinia borealis (strain F-4128) TaxID=1432307 RepID=W9CR08_SCLBF|nr:alcohol dehydrogenase [Sclerotinia borealis F-4128]
MAFEGVPEKMLAAQVIEPLPPSATPTPLVVAGIMGTPLPCTASHEGAGTIVAVGSRVSGFKPGDRILCSLTCHRCGVCTNCIGPEHEQKYCTNAGGHLEVMRHGSFAEYEVVDGRECSLLPHNVSFQSAAPLVCAGITIWGGLVRAGLKSGEWIAIVGAGGGLGHLGAQFAKAFGLNVIAIDARDEGLQLAKDCGADVLVDARQSKDKVVEDVQRVTGDQGADSTLNVTDHESAAATAVAVTRRHGTMIQIAQPENVSVPFAELIFRDIRIHGNLVGSRGEAQKMLELVSKHNIKVQTNPFKGLREIPKAVELAHSGKMKGKPVIVIDEKAIQNENQSGLQMI